MEYVGSQGDRGRQGAEHGRAGAEARPVSSGETRIPRELLQLVQRQRQFLAMGKTRSAAFREAQLRKLRDAIKHQEAEIVAALRKDLGKPEIEALAGEVSFVFDLIQQALKELREWMRPRRAATPLLQQPSVSRVFPEARGLVLIAGAWGAPFGSLFGPAVSAIAAGNCVVLRPATEAPATAAVLGRLMERTFSPESCAYIDEDFFEPLAGRVTTPDVATLAAAHFDVIAYAGNAHGARQVLRAAAEHLTPVVTMLGGKNPVIVDRGIDADVAARRIAWGKFHGVGQSSIAPDYVLVHRQIVKDLVQGLRAAIIDFYGQDPSKSPDYGRIASRLHLDRLVSLIDPGKVLIGGSYDEKTLYLAPTVMGDVHPVDDVMESEIFGPILPLVEFSSLDQALMLARRHPNSLACYVFTNDARFEQRVLSELSFGGGCINDTLIHAMNPVMPFSGVGASGYGALFGRAGFETFSHQKAVVKSSLTMDMRWKYPPYGDATRSVLRRFFK